MKYQYTQRLLRAIELYEEIVSPFYWHRSMVQLKQLLQGGRLNDLDMHKQALKLFKNADFGDNERLVLQSYYDAIKANRSQIAEIHLQTEKQKRQISEKTQLIDALLKDILSEHENKPINSKERTTIRLFEEEDSITLEALIGFSDEAIVDCSRLHRVGPGDLEALRITERGFIYKKESIEDWLSREPSDPSTREEIHYLYQLTYDKLDFDLLNQLLNLERIKLLSVNLDVKWFSSKEKLRQLLDKFDKEESNWSNSSDSSDSYNEESSSILTQARFLFFKAERDPEIDNLELAFLDNFYKDHHSSCCHLI